MEYNSLSTRGWNKILIALLLLACRFSAKLTYLQTSSDIKTLILSDEFHDYYYDFREVKITHSTEVKTQTHVTTNITEQYPVWKVTPTIVELNLTKFAIDGSESWYIDFSIITLSNQSIAADSVRCYAPVDLTNTSISNVKCVDMY